MYATTNLSNQEHGLETGHLLAWVGDPEDGIKFDPPAPIEHIASMTDLGDGIGWTCEVMVTIWHASPHTDLRTGEVVTYPRMMGLVLDPDTDVGFYTEIEDVR